jgi:hypothetical protein
MGLTFAFLFLALLGFWWLAGHLIDDVLDGCESLWSRAWAHEHLARNETTAASLERPAATTNRRTP